MKIYEFSDRGLVLTAGDGGLRKVSGEPVEMRPQSREVLRLMAATPGEVVTKDTFAREVWDGRLVGEDSLVQCIAEIRAALGDGARNIVQTVPRKGYRLVVPEAAPVRRRWPVLVVALVCVLLAGAGLVRWLMPGPGPASVIAVLPLDDLSPAPRQGYLSDALSEGIITALARFPQFDVIARNSSFQFREAPRDIREIGAALGADYVLEGSQQFDGERVRVTVQLIDAGQGLHVLSERYDSALGDLFDIQDQIVRQVAGKVGDRVMGDLPARGTPGDVDARLRGLQARKLMTRFTRENWEQALALEQTSVREEPGSAWGHIGVAMMLANGATQGWTTPRAERLAEAAEEAGTALRLAPENYMSHYALARVLVAQEAPEEALLHFRRAAALNPSDSLVLIGMSEPLLLAGETSEAIEVLRRAAAVDPLHGDWLRWQMGWAYWQNDECEKGLEAMLAMAAPPAPSRKVLAALHVCLGRTHEAREAMRIFLAAHPGYTLADERARTPETWKPEGIGPRWLDAMRAAGMPPG